MNLKDAKKLKKMFEEYGYYATSIFRGEKRGDNTVTVYTGKFKLDTEDIDLFFPRNYEGYADEIELYVEENGDIRISYT